MPSLKFQNGICLPALKPSNKPIKWHSSADASFDFSSGNSRVEVKTTRSLNRIHQFSSNQISDGLQATVL